MSRTLRYSAAVLLAGVLAGILSSSLVQRYHQEREALYLLEGKTLFHQVRRTYSVFRPKNLLHELYARAEDKPTVLRYLALEPGMNVADVGCGSGYFTMDLARAVGPTGSVVALDIQAPSVAFLDERWQLLGCAGCGSLRTWVSRVDDALIPASSVDVALMANLDFYSFQQQLPENTRMLESCFEGLKPGGHLVVVQDLSANTGTRAEYIQANFEAVGFRTEGQHTFTEPSVLFVFRRPLQ